jgi:ubiquinone/menaquinone biosynthesis C-methylase UbiE
MHDQRAFFDSRADGWEEKCYPPDVRGRLRELVQEFKITPGTCVLDVGTGPGVLNPYLRELTGDDGTIVAFDLSGNMIRQARKKTLTPLDLFFQGDAQAMALGHARFDHVICFAAFPHFPDPLAALRELCRVARPGGEVVIAHLLSREELARHHGNHDAVADDVLPDAQGMRKLFALAGLREPLIIDCPGRYMARAEKP